MYAELIESPQAETLGRLRVLDNDFQGLGKVERRQLQVHVASLPGGDVSVLLHECVRGGKQKLGVALLEIHQRGPNVSERKVNEAISTKDCIHSRERIDGYNQRYELPAITTKQLSVPAD